VNSNQGWMLPGEITAAVGREYGWPALKDIPKLGAIDQEAVYAGTYEKDGQQIRITQDGTRLLVAFSHQQALPLYPTAAGEFFAKAINLRLRFGEADPARPSELTVIHGPKTAVFKRTG
jgi:hypothetical protein